MMMQSEMYDLALMRNSRFPNYLARRLQDVARLCDRSHQGEFFLGLVRFVRPYSIYMTGV